MKLVELVKQVEEWLSKWMKEYDMRNKNGKEICRYILMKQVPKSKEDLKRELPWYNYGSLIEKEVKFDRETLEYLCDMCALHLDTKTMNKIRKVLK